MRSPDPAVRLIGRPILLAQTAASQLMLAPPDGGQGRGVMARLSSLLRGATRPEPKAEAAVPEALAGRSFAVRPGYLLCEGVAVIRIDGVIYDEGFTVDWGDFSYSAFGYDNIRAAVRAALADDMVKAVWLRINSPGGHVQGLFETCALLAGSPKPVGAFVAGDGCSAAYALAVCASAPRLVCAPAATTGSIGAVIVHVDTSEADKRWGYTITPIQFGAAKTDGWPFKPLDEAAAAHLQAQIDTIGERFVAHVAARRGLSTEAVKATEARVEMDERARELGLVDAVLPEVEAFAGFLAGLATDPAGAPASPAPQPASAQGANQEGPMGLKQKLAAFFTGATKSAKSADEKLEEIKTIIDEADEDEDEEEGSGKEAAADGEGEPEASSDDDEDKPSARRAKAEPKAGSAAYVLAVTGLPEAKGREDAARDIAASGKFTVAEAKTFLAKLPKKTGFAPQNPAVAATGGSGADPSASWDRALKASGVARKSA